MIATVYAGLFNGVNNVLDRAAYLAYAAWIMFSLLMLASVAVADTEDPDNWDDPPVPAGLTAPSTDEDGTYVVSWFASSWQRPSAWVFELQEKADSGNWTTIHSQTANSKILSGKSLGNYSYRVRACNITSWCSNYGSVITVTVLPPVVLESINVQKNYIFEARAGYYDANSRKDIYIRRTAGGDPDDGILYETIITQDLDGTFSVLPYDINALSVGSTWSVINAEISVDDFNVDGMVDIHLGNFQTSIPNVNDQFIYSSGIAYNRNAAAVVSVDEEMQMFYRDFEEWMDNPNYFDQAGSPDEDGYNIRIESIIRICSIFWGFTFCVDETVTLADFDISLADLGLDGFLGVQSKVSPAGVSLNNVGTYYNSQVNAIAQPVLTANNITNLPDLHAYTNDMAVATQELAPVLSDISNSPDVLRCVFWCGRGPRTYFSNGYIDIFFVDTWTPISIPGDFDSINYSIDAFDMSNEIDKIVGGDPDGSIQKVVGVLERVLDVLIGGWGTNFPGTIDTDTAAGYGLVLSLESTRRFFKTPPCIKNDLGYFQTRIDEYLSPTDLPGDFSNIVQNFGTVEILTGPNVIWGIPPNRHRYSYIASFQFGELGDFGFFDAQHGALAYAIVDGALTSEATLRRWELIWELSQGFNCSSSFIREDMFSNHAGAEAAHRYDNDSTKTPGEHLIDILNESGAVVSRSTAVALLNSEGFAVKK